MLTQSLRVDVQSQCMSHMQFVHGRYVLAPLAGRRVTGELGLAEPAAGVADAGCLVVGVDEGGHEGGHEDEEVGEHGVACWVG
jgi:hypothetical protein